MSLPEPRAGLVICYSYLWAREHKAGSEEGRKDRPCAIVAARQVIEGRDVVTVVPVTHTRPQNVAEAIEIPPGLKAHLGLDDAPSWVVLTETNDFLWPGPVWHASATLLRPPARQAVADAPRAETGASFTHGLAPMVETPICPETRARMRRDERPMTLDYKGQSITFNMPGW